MRVREAILMVAMAGVLGVVASPTGYAADADRKLVVRYEPVYPELARQMRLSGVVVLGILIAPDGHVGEVTVQSGHPLLVRAAEEAVRRWRYATANEPTGTIVSVKFSVAN